MGKEKLRIKLFERFRADLEFVYNLVGCNKELLKEMLLRGVIPCPICMRLFTKDHLKSDPVHNHLTIEDIPPKNTGEKIQILTCKDCNNKFSNADNLLKYTIPKYKDYPNRFPVKILIDDKKIGAEVHINIDDRKIFYELPNQEIKLDLKKFLETTESTNTIVKDGSKLIKADLLRIAYLLAFDKFGHRLILSEEYKLIREQINNPFKDIIPSFGMCLVKDPLLADGVYKVELPERIKCILVTFSLSLKNTECKSSFMINLPLLGGNVIELYENLISLPADSAVILQQY
jgi:hypothetical protein